MTGSSVSRPMAQASCRSPAFCHLPLRQYRSGAYVCRSHQKSCMSLLLLYQAATFSQTNINVRHRYCVISQCSGHQSARLLQQRSGWSVRHPPAAAAKCTQHCGAARLIARRRSSTASRQQYATFSTGCQSDNVSTLNCLCLCSTASVTQHPVTQAYC